MLAPSTPPRPLALDDAELDTVMRAAGVLNVVDRDPFLHAVAFALQQQPELGPGIVARVCAEAQKRFWRPPALDARVNGGKYAR
jgi:hypothetical protein